MSNLNLPTLNYEILKTIVPGEGDRKKLAYATTAERVGAYVYIKHHASVIAVIGRNHVAVSMCGWDSTTTADRVRRVLQGNSIPWTVRIKDGCATLYRREGSTQRLICLMTGFEAFKHNGMHWVRVGDAA